MTISLMAQGPGCPAKTGRSRLARLDGVTRVLKLQHYSLMRPAIEFVISELIRWAVCEARRIGYRGDAGDRAFGAGMDRLQNLITRRPGPDSALTHLRSEASAAAATPGAGQPRRLRVQDGAANDRGSPSELGALVASVAVEDHGIAVDGNVDIQAVHGSAGFITDAASVEGERPNRHRPGPAHALTPHGSPHPLRSTPDHQSPWTYCRVGRGWRW